MRPRFQNYFGRKSGTLLLLAGIVVLMLPSIFWILLDRTVWPWDQAWYGEVSIGLWRQIARDPSRWVGSMLSAFGSKPPGVAWIGEAFVPIGFRFGNVDVALLASILVTQGAALVPVFQLLRELKPPGLRCLILPTLFIASAPLFIGLSHQFLVEPLQLFAVAWLGWIAASAPRLNFTSLAAHLTAASAVAMLAKTTTGIYGWAFALVGIRELWIKRSAWRAGGLAKNGLALVALAGGSLVLGMAAAWYFLNWNSVVGHIQFSSSELALNYGSTRPFLIKLWFWLTKLGSATALPEVLLAFAFLVAVSAAMNVRRAGRLTLARFTRLDLLSYCAGAQLATTLVVLSLHIYEDTRFLLAALPSVAILLARLLAGVRSRPICWTLALLLLWQWGMIHLHALGFSPRKGIPERWIIVAAPNLDRASELQRIVAATTATEPTEKRLVICGVDYDWLNANSLSYTAAKQTILKGGPSTYVPLGFAEVNADHAWQRLSELAPAFLVMLDEERQPSNTDFLNRTNAGILRRVRADSRFVDRQFSSSLGVVIFQNFASGELHAD